MPLVVGSLLRKREPISFQTVETNTYLVTFLGQDLLAGCNLCVIYHPLRVRVFKVNKRVLSCCL